MTTVSMGNKQRSRWSFLGPWPLQAIPLAATVGLLTIALGLDVGPWFAQKSTIAVGVATGLLTWAILAAAARWLPTIVSNPVGYVAVLVGLALVITSVRVVADIAPVNPDLPVRFTGTAIANAVFLLIFQTIFGSVHARLREETARANRAVEIVEEQRGVLLRADEQVRRQVAIALHDRVQGGLVSACLRLQMVLRQEDPPQEQLHEIAAVITQLEQLRALDVRRAVRSLSPNLRDIDMQTSLEELADTWTSSLDVNVHIDGRLPKDPELQLGIYRIIEQGLLNVASHAGAERCDVDVRAGDIVVVTIDDDGVGLPVNPTQGLGSVLLTTWCKTLGGRWWWGASPLGGVCLHAELPARSDPVG